MLRKTNCTYRTCRCCFAYRVPRWHASQRNIYKCRQIIIIILLFKITNNVKELLWMNLAGQLTGFKRHANTQTPLLHLKSTSKGRERTIFHVNVSKKIYRVASFTVQTTLLLRDV